MRAFFIYDKIRYEITILPSKSKILNNGDNMEDYEFCHFIGNDGTLTYTVSSRKVIIRSVHPETNEQAWLIPKVCIVTEKE